MCIELALFDAVEQQHYDLLRTLMLSYSPAIEATEYNKIFDACFNLADFICMAESTRESYDDCDIKAFSAYYVIQAISDLMDEIDDVESIAYQMIVLLIQHALTQEGRLQNAIEIMDDHFNSKYGICDVISQNSIFTNFMKQ